uniref:Reverse transcriptase/retrotransposon-derived protein RNase H-like domain-containing protein n=1 Tax=Amphimedon queenslandica TaxID=400682 RepID=A0A1X7VWZ0_AMPQE
DLVIFSATWEDHLEQLATVLGRLQEAGLTVKPSKCQFAVKECTYLRHVIGGGKVAPVKDKLEVIKDFPRPESKTHVCNNSSSTNRSYKEVTTTTSQMDDCEQSFRALKAALTSSPVLRSPDFTRPFVLQTDALDYGVGAVLSQCDYQGFDHPVLYFSRKLLPKEQHYAT